MIESRPVNFQCAGESLLGIFEEASQSKNRGVIIVVGGPQYRVGSHRQFVFMSRTLAESGYTTLRFDHRGIGDSTGSSSFEDLGPDISAAIDTFCRHYPRVSEIVLWGLCDAASAIMMYAASDARVRGIVALNPWVRNEASLARTYVSNYYLDRLASRAFWRRILSGQVNILRSLREFFRNLMIATHGSGQNDTQSASNKSRSGNVGFQDRMMHGLGKFTGQSLLVLSGRDITANEFKQYVAENRARRKTLDKTSITVLELPQADHTFSTAEWRDQVESWTLEWMDSW